MSIRLLLALLVGTALVTSAWAQERPPAPYDFERPVAIHELDKDLEEISGLTMIDERTLAAIQDEDGTLFFIDPVTGKVIDDRKFGKDADYEGIERAGDRLFVVRSNGTLYEIEDWTTDDPKDEKFETPLRSRHDVEGLAYDAERNRLLLACKGFPGKGLSDKKSVYAFDLATMTLDRTPAYLIDTGSFNEQYREKEGSLSGAVRSLLHGAFDLSGLAPSAIAFHPITRELYVVSSGRRALVVLSPSGDVEAVWPLPESVLDQPEGITFMPNGDLFLASEAGDRKRGVLVRYTYQPPQTDVPEGSR